MLLGAGGLSVDTSSPDALCPPLEKTRLAVESRLGSVELEGTWRATYVLVHREVGDWVVLKLLDPTGSVRLEREFSASNGSCATLAQVIALVLERYFLRPETQLAATVAASDATDGTELPSQPSSPRRRELKVSSNRSSGVAPAGPDLDKRFGAPEARAPQRVALSLDAGLWASTAWMAPTLGVGLGGMGRWSVGVQGGFDLSDHESRTSSGWGKSRRLPLTLAVRGQVLESGAFKFNLGGELLGLYETVQTLGLAQTGAGARLVPGLGLRAGAERSAGRGRFGPYLEVTSSMLLSGLSRPFEIDEQPAFELPNYVFGVHFGIRTIL